MRTTSIRSQPPQVSEKTYAGRAWVSVLDAMMHRLQKETLVIKSTRKAVPKGFASSPGRFHGAHAQAFNEVVFPDLI